MATDTSQSAASSLPSGQRRSSRLNSLDTIRRYKDFRLIWIGNFFAQGAQWLQILTIGWLVLKLTDGNALLTGTVVGIRTLPILLIGPWAGVLADRIDRRKLIMATQLVMVGAAVGFAFLVIASDLDASATGSALANGVSSVGPTECRREEFRSVRCAVVGEQCHRFVNDRVG